MLKIFHTNDALTRAEAYIALTSLSFSESRSEPKLRAMNRMKIRTRSQKKQIDYLTTTLESIRRTQAILDLEGK